MTNNVILQTKGLGISFGGLHALKAIDFELKQGELRCLIGPNGAGKTTFFRLLSGQHNPTRGEISFRGNKIVKMMPYQLARLGIGVKTQVPSLFEGLSVADNLELATPPSGTKKQTKQQIDAVLDRIAMTENRNTLTSDLSHGQRQWVELGLILASKPMLALLDEPAAGMTHNESVKTVDIIKQIATTSAVVVVEHDMDFIRMIGGIVTVFDQGEVIAEGTLQSVAKDSRVRAAYLGRKDVSHA